MDSETQSRTVIVSPVTIDLNIKTIREAFSEIGELEGIRINPQEAEAIVTFKRLKCVREALSRDGATIEGQVVRIRSMTKEDSQLNREKERIQGGSLEIADYEKRAFAILSSPVSDREEKLRDQLSLLPKQEKDAFIETYRRCESIQQTRERFDAAVEAANSPSYVEPDLSDSSSDSRSSSSSYDRGHRSRERRRSRSRRHSSSHRHHRRSRS